MSPEKDEKVGKGGSVLEDLEERLASSIICENDSKKMQDEVVLR